MKQIIIDKPFKIVFINEEDDRTVEIIDDKNLFKIPKVGDHFEFSEKCRTNIVTKVYHDFQEKEILIWYDWFAEYENNCIKENEFFETYHESNQKKPKEKF